MELYHWQAFTVVFGLFTFGMLLKINREAQSTPNNLYATSLAWLMIAALAYGFGEACNLIWGT